MYNVKKSRVKKASHRFKRLVGVSESIRLKSRQCQDKGSFHLGTYLLFCFLKDKFYTKKILTYAFQKYLSHKSAVKVKMIII